MGSCSNSNALLLLHPTRIGFFLAWLLASLCRVVHVAFTWRVVVLTTRLTRHAKGVSKTRGRSQGQGRGLSFFEKRWAATPTPTPRFTPTRTTSQARKNSLLAGYDCYQQFWNIRHTHTSIIQIPFRTSRVMNWKVRQSKSGWGGSELRWLRCIWRKIDSVYFSLDILGF